MLVTDSVLQILSQYSSLKEFKLNVGSLIKTFPVSSTLKPESQNLHIFILEQI